MSKAKRYSVPIVFGIIAVALLAVGVLALTVWRPAQQVSATHDSTEPFAMTRAGVFPLYADSVKINATAEPDQDVWLAVGSPEDITAWLQDEPYEEVVGLLDLQTLKQFPTGLRRIHNLEKLNQVATQRVWKSHSQVLRLSGPLARTCGSRKTMGADLSVSH